MPTPNVSFSFIVNLILFLICGYFAENAFAFLFQELRANLQTPLVHHPSVSPVSTLKRKYLNGNIPSRIILVQCGQFILIFGSFYFLNCHKFKDFVGFMNIYI